MILTKEYLHECFEYVDGKLFWKFRPLHHFKNKSSHKAFNTAYAGNEAGYINERSDSKKEGFAYHRVYVGGKLQKTHRIIFMMFNGYIPLVVDHIDNNPLNNRIENLRESDVRRNAANSSTNYNKKTKGVSLDKRLRQRGSECCYRVSLEISDKSIYVGLFETESEAQTAYNLACIQLGIKDFRPVSSDFTGTVRETNFFKNNNFSVDSKLVEEYLLQTKSP